MANSDEIKRRQKAINILLDGGISKTQDPIILASAKDSIEKLKSVFEFIPIPPDGDCLFHALEAYFAIYGNLPIDIPNYNHQTLRRFTVNYLIDNLDKYRNIIYNTNDIANLKDHYREGFWNNSIGDIMPRVAADALGLHITLFDYRRAGQKGAESLQITHNTIHGGTGGDVYLLRMGNHFTLLIPFTDTNDSRIRDNLQNALDLYTYVLGEDREGMSPETAAADWRKIYTLTPVELTEEQLEDADEAIKDELAFRKKQNEDEKKSRPPVVPPPVMEESDFKNLSQTVNKGKEKRLSVNAAKLASSMAQSAAVNATLGPAPPPSQLYPLPIAQPRVNLPTSSPPPASITGTNTFRRPGKRTFSYPIKSS